MSGRMHAQAGFGLVEIMVSMTISLIMVGAIISLTMNTSRSNRELREITQMVDNAQFASDLMREQIQHAGYFGSLSPEDAQDWPVLPAVLQDPCNVANLAALRSSLVLPVQGQNDPAGDPQNSCLSDADHADGTDILFIRRAAIQPVSPALAKAAASKESTYWMQASPIVFSLGHQVDIDPEKGLGVNELVGAGASQPASMRQIHVDGFYISPSPNPVDVPACSPAAHPGTQLPTLMRLRLVGTTHCAEPLATGIENMQLEYGVDDDRDGSADRYVEDPSDLLAWSNVVSVQMYLLALGQNASNDSPARSFVLGDGEAGPDKTDTHVAPDDGLRREVFAGTVRLVNVSARRETP